LINDEKKKPEITESLFFKALGRIEPHLVFEEIGGK